MIIKAIQTKYRGCNFRSRIEARWAVFFDAAKIEWYYEYQGYVVDGKPYLPDFFLPKLDCHFEVKGAAGYDLRFFWRFAQLSCKPIVVAEGDIPFPDLSDCGKTIGLQFIKPISPSTYDLAWGYNDMFLQCTNCNIVKIMNEVYSGMKSSCGSCGAENIRWTPLSAALKRAKSERFGS